MDLFLAEHTLTHARAVATEDGSTEDPFARGLTDAQLRLRPVGLNSVAWNLFHVARTEDVGLNVLIAGGPQVLDDEGWLPRLGVERRDSGAGMDDGEVDDLTAQLDLAALSAYRLAVGRRTREIVSALEPQPLARPVDPDRVAAAVAQGAVHPSLIGAVERAWGGRSTGWFLFFGAGHNLWHFGEVQTIRSLIARAERS